MALAHLMPSISPCSCACWFEDQRNLSSRFAFLLSGASNVSSRVGKGAYPLWLSWRRRGVVVVEGRGRSNVKEFQTTTVDNGGQIRSGVEVPVTCYQSSDVKELDFQFLLEDLETIKVIGKGSGGVIQLVRHKWVGRLFALKVDVTLSDGTYARAAVPSGASTF